MTIRMSGLSSGLDTDAIVSALVSAYSYKKEKYEKAQTKLSWTQDAWKSLNTKVYSFYSNVSNLRFSSAYSLKKTSVSDSTKATATATNTAPNGTQKLNVIKVAQTASLTGAELEDADSESTTLAELGYSGGTANITVQMKNGTTSDVSFDGTTKLSEIATKFKEAGLNANYDASNKRFYISSKTSGTDGDFSLLGANSDGATALSTLGISVASSSDYSSYASLHGSTDSDTESNIVSAISAYTTAQSTINIKTEENSNMVAAMSYGTAYASVQDLYTSKGITDETTQTLLSKLASSSRDNSIVVGTDIYTKTSSTDTDGNTVYVMSDSDGNNSYISAKTTYTYTDSDGNTKIYKKDSDGNYINVDDSEDKYTGDTSELTENITYFKTTESISYKDADDNEYTITKNDDGTETYTSVSDSTKVYTKSTDGKFYEGTSVSETEASVSISARYSYDATSDEVTSSTKTAQATYNDLLEEYDISETEASTYASNISTINSFESREDTYLTSDNSEYTIEKIKVAIQEAYANGGSDKAGAVSTLTKAYSSTITSNKSTISDNQDILDDNSVVANISKLTEGSDKYNSALTSLVEKVNSAYTISNSGVTTSEGANKTAGEDSKIILNGVTYTSTSNSYTINGLTIEALQVTGEGDENAISITTGTDTQGIYDKIKSFLTEYNNIINEMTSLYNADSAGSYEPLTDDEKEAMTDTEIEKWETKIKNSLLRSDTTLNGIMTAMSNAMSGSIEIGTGDNKKTYSLVSFGIHTLGYLNAAEDEENAYHIDGDEDDSNTSSNTDKLMEAITNDPDTVMDFMQQLTSKLYTAIGNKMSRSSLSSAYTIYNDKQMSSQYNEYTDLIEEWETRIADKEDYYYDKFSSMESSLATLNSTQSSLSSYFS